MLIQLALAIVMAALTVLIHLAGLALLMRLLSSHARVVGRLRVFPFTTLLGATLGIIGIHTAEIWFYAAAYMFLGAFPHFEAALYFSTVTYSSVGYGDLLMPHAWRI